MKKRNILIAGITLVALIAAGALAALALSGDTPGDPAVLTAADDGRSIDLGVGDSFSVVLEGNLTTGYGWQVQSIDSAVLVAGEPQYQSESTLVGAGGTFTITFTALAAGETEVELGYLRPWETADPLETFTLSVTVR